MRYILSVILLVLLNVSVAHTAPRTLKITVVCAGLSPDCRAAYQAVERATRIISDQVPAVKFKIVALREENVQLFADVQVQWLWWMDHLYYPMLRDRADMAIVIFPEDASSPDAGDPNILGVAPVGSIGNMQTVALVRTFAGKTAHVTAHEIGHTLGAYHSRCGLMGPAVSGKCASKTMTRDTTRQINFFLKNGYTLRERVEFH